MIIQNSALCLFHYQSVGNICINFPALKLIGMCPQAINSEYENPSIKIGDGWRVNKNVPKGWSKSRLS